MAAPQKLVIESLIAETERPVLSATAELLGASLAEASGSKWDIRARAHESIATMGAISSPFVAVLSLLPSLAAAGESIAQTEARLRRDIAALAGKSPAGIFLCTIFRVVSNPVLASPNPGPRPSVERLRRLNLLAAELSHDFSVYVADIDRNFAHVGARILRTDYRLTGRLATGAAAHVIVSTILSAGLDDIIAPDVQERAKRFLGDMGTLARSGARRPGQSERTETHGAG